MLKKTPAPINFSEKKDEPLENIDKAIEQRETMRQLPQLPIELKMPEQINWGQVIKNQNDILIKILETQIKIIQMIKK